jgi:hypothetical protein
MSLWVANDAKGTLIEPPNQTPTNALLGQVELPEKPRLTGHLEQE